MTRLSDLSPEQIHMMITLDDGFEHADSVGRELDSFNWIDITTADSLVLLGLVELVPGYDGRQWYRLTEEGRRVRDKGRPG